MRKEIVIIMLTGLLISCVDSLREKQEKRCENLKNQALKEIDMGNLRPILKGKYLYSTVERYYIWKKYKVNITYPIHSNELYQIELDSCYNSTMLEHAPKSKIVKDLDSLTQSKLVSEYAFPKSKYIKKYHDGTYLVVHDARNKYYTPIRIDTNYFTKLKEFKTRFEESLSDTIKCEFWYEIDTFGIVKNIDIVQHATEKIDKAVKEFYSSFIYEPANDGVKKLKCRNNDFIYFLGKRKN